MKKLLTIAIIVLAVSCLAQATNVTTIVKYDFGTYNNETLAPSIQAAHITASSFGYIGDGTAGFTSSGHPDSARQVDGGWPDDEYADYFSFTVTIESGWSLDLDVSSVAFDAKTTNISGPDSAKVTYLLGASETTFNDGIEIGGSSWHSYDTYKLQPPTGLTGVVEFRIYGKDATASGQFDIDNVILNGTINAIPEPTTICILGLGALSLVRRKKSA